MLPLSSTQVTHRIRSDATPKLPSATATQEQKTRGLHHFLQASCISHLLVPRQSRRPHPLNSCITSAVGPTPPPAVRMDGLDRTITWFTRTRGAAHLCGSAVWPERHVRVKEMLSDFAVSLRHRQVSLVRLAWTACIPARLVSIVAALEPFFGPALLVHVGPIYN